MLLYKSIISDRTTANATIPSSRPVKPSFSVVVAFIEMFSGTVSRMAEMIFLHFRSI